MAYLAAAVIVVAALGATAYFVSTGHWAFALLCIVLAGSVGVRKRRE